MKKLQKMLALCLGLALMAGAVRAQDAAEDAGDDAADAEERVENKLVALHTLEGAFLKAVRRRQLLARLVLQETNKLDDVEDEEKQAEIRKNIGAARKALAEISNAMEVIFGIGRRRDYEYNQVTSTVYLKVGTVEDAFSRAVRTRDSLLKFVGEQRALLEAEQDEEKKAEIEKKIAVGTRQYQVVAASLQLIFQVNQQRNYLYNPKNSTLYLRVTEEEVGKIKAALAEQQAAREDATEGATEADTGVGE